MGLLLLWGRPFTVVDGDKINITIIKLDVSSDAYLTLKGIPG